MYFSYQAHTLDGKSLKIYLPLPTKKSQYEDRLKFYKQIDDRKLYVVKDTKDIIRECHIHNTLKESINYIRKDLIYSIEWISDDKNAPPGNPDVYVAKCRDALTELENKYINKFPEIFL